MCLYTKIRKKYSRSKNVAERRNILVFRLSWHVYLPTDYKSVYATTQPELPEPPFSASVGRAVASSESEVSRTMEGDVAKRSIAVSN